MSEIGIAVSGHNTEYSVSLWRTPVAELVVFPEFERALQKGRIEPVKQIRLDRVIF